MSNDGAASDPTLCERDERSPEAQADGFASVRQAHGTEMAEDYVELISELIGSVGEARPVDIADRLGVKPPTVTRNLARLKRDGLIWRERYRAVFLTEQGEALANACRARHRTVVSFLIALGIEKEIAERDAEGIEHHVSDTTLAAFERFLSVHDDGESAGAIASSAVETRRRRRAGTD